MSKLKGTVSHHEREVAELRADRELATEYLKAAMESLDNPDDRAAGLLALQPMIPDGDGIWDSSLREDCRKRVLFLAWERPTFLQTFFASRPTSVRAWRSS